MIKVSIVKLKEELEKLAQEHEAKKMQKCAQILLAATGLEILRGRVGIKSEGSK